MRDFAFDFEEDFAVEEFAEEDFAEEEEEFKDTHGS